eukprot:513198-Hanusia_phi.AAC.1
MPRHAVRLRAELARNRSMAARRAPRSGTAARPGSCRRPGGRMPVPAACHGHVVNLGCCVSDGRRVSGPSVLSHESRRSDRIAAAGGPRPPRPPRLRASLIIKLNKVTVSRRL